MVATALCKVQASAAFPPCLWPSVAPGCQRAEVLGLLRCWVIAAAVGDAAAAAPSTLPMQTIGLIKL